MPEELKVQIHNIQNGSGDADANSVRKIKTLAPPFTDLCLIPYMIGYRLQKQKEETAIKDLLRTPSVIIIDAGSPKVQSRLYGGVYPGLVSP